MSSELQPHLPRVLREELEAVASMTAQLGKPTFIHKSNWRDGYATLVRRGLVTWGRFMDGSFGPDFRSVELTERGRAALAKAEGNNQ